MKNRFKLFGIIAVVAVVGFSMTGCAHIRRTGEIRAEDFWVTGGHGTVTIIRYTGRESYVQIPAQIGGSSVVEIGSFLRDNIARSNPHLRGAFQGGRLTGVTIPGSVFHIGDSAFASNQLASVNIPNGVTTIGNMAFRNNQLTSVTISSSVMVIGAGAFAGNRLTAVTIPSNVRAIGAGAFARNRFTSVTIPFSSLLEADLAWGGTEWRRGICPNVIVPTR